MPKRISDYLKNLRLHTHTFTNNVVRKSKFTGDNRCGCCCSSCRDFSCCGCWRCSCTVCVHTASEKVFTF